MFGSKTTAAEPVEPAEKVQTYGEWLDASNALTLAAEEPDALFQIVRVEGKSEWRILKWERFVNPGSWGIARERPFDLLPITNVGYGSYTEQHFDSLALAERWLTDNLKGPETVSYDARGNRLEPNGESK